MQNSRIIQLTFLTALAPVFWGTTYIVTTQLLPEGRPFIAALIRVLPAGVFLIFLSGQMPRKADVPKLIILSFLNIGCFQALLFVAAYLLPGGIAAVVGAMQPLLMMLFIWMFERERPTVLSGTLAVAALIGMAMMMLRPDASLNPTGLAAAFGGAVCMSLGTFFASRWRVELSLQSFTGWQLFLGGLMLLPLAAVFETVPAHLTLRNYAGYGYLAFFGTLVAYYLWFYGVKRLPAVAVSVLGLLSPVTAVVVGWVILGQSLGAVQFAGFCAVLVCIVWMQIAVNKRVKRS